MRHIDVHKMADGASFNRFHFGILAWCAIIIICDGYDLAVAGIAIQASRWPSGSWAIFPADAVIWL